MIGRVLVIGLAVWRGQRAWYTEQVGAKPRDAVEDWLDRPVLGVDDEVLVNLTAIKRWLRDLHDCPYCSSFWCALAASIGWRWGWARRLLVAFAAAGVTALLIDGWPEPDWDGDREDRDEQTDAQEHLASEPTA